MDSTTDKERKKLALKDKRKREKKNLVRKSKETGEMSISRRQDNK
jgi:hypothetical protein